MNALPATEIEPKRVRCIYSDEALRACACDLIRREISYVPNRGFLAYDPDVDASSNREEPGVSQSSSWHAPSSGSKGKKDDFSPPSGFPSHLARLCETELLTADQERGLFRRMNLLKFRANQHRSRIDPERPDRLAIEKIQQLLAESQITRDQLIRSNTRLAMSIARKFVTPQISFDDLLSDALVALMYAVEKFDYDRGFRFSTYAYLAISRSLYGLVKKCHKESARLIRFDSSVVDSVEDRSRSEIADQQEQRHRELLTRCLDRLDRREQFILRSRFALGAHRKKRTCRELGERLGISKERVRQIERRAVSKIEALVADEYDFTAPDIPDE